MKTASDSATHPPGKSPSKPQPRSGRKTAEPVDKGATGQLPHERDQTPESAGDEPRDDMRQAHEDIESGQVDTDMRATPGLDAAQRKKLVKTPR